MTKRKIKPKKNIYDIEVYAYNKYKGKRYKETALNTRVYGSSVDQVTKDARKRYPRGWTIKVKLHKRNAR